MICPLFFGYSLLSKLIILFHSLKIDFKKKKKIPPPLNVVDIFFCPPNFADSRSRDFVRVIRVVFCRFTLPGPTHLLYHWLFHSIDILFSPISLLYMDEKYGANHIYSTDEMYGANKLNNIIIFSRLPFSKTILPLYNN